MRAVIDANILIYVHGLRIWPNILDFLQRCDMVLVTIDSVYRRELPDTLRHTVDDLIAQDRLDLVEDPDKTAHQDKPTRNARRKINRAASRWTTSAIDQQLLLIASRDALPLLTDERPLQQLADWCNHTPCYDLLDIIDLLYMTGCITPPRRSTILSNRPGGRQADEAELNESLSQRGSTDRFGCAPDLIVDRDEPAD